MFTHPSRGQDLPCRVRLASPVRLSRAAEDATAYRRGYRAPWRPFSVALVSLPARIGGGSRYVSPVPVVHTRRHGKGPGAAWMPTRGPGHGACA